MIYSVRWQLLLSMVAVILITVGMTAFFANQAATAQIERVQGQDDVIRDRRLTAILTRHFLQHDTWEGVQVLLENTAELTGERLVITDPSGVVIADSHRTFVGRHLEPDIPRRSSSAITGPQGRLGTLVVNPDLPSVPPTVSFPNRASLNPSLSVLLLLSGMLAVGVAMILTFFVSHRILAPVESLARVSRLAAQRNFTGRAEVTSRDEVGELARTFNSMLDELSRTEETRRNLVADVAHELRTPVTNIRGYIEGISDSVIDLDQATLDSIHSETLLLTRLIEDLQDLALAESGQMELRTQLCDLGSLVTSATTSVQPLAQARKVNLSVDQVPDLIINADPQRISQVLRNLLVNAVTYTPEKGQIFVESYPQNGHALVSIKNTGEGIPAEDLPYIFERFYRVDKSRSRSTGGVGLGLTITKRLVEAHGGTIEALSPEGQGTHMLITLPRETSN